MGDGVGVAVDVYHVWWDPDLEAQIARAGSRILGFHVCDWLVPTRDLLLDRGMMGDGVIDLPHIRGLVEKAGYKGCIEVEIFSARELVEDSRATRCCAPASSATAPSADRERHGDPGTPAAFDVRLAQYGRA